MGLTPEREAELIQKSKDLDLYGLDLHKSDDVDEGPGVLVWTAADELFAAEHELALAGHKDFGFIHVGWNVTGVHSQTHEFFQRRLLLDAATLTPRELCEVRRITKSSNASVKATMLKFRQHFREAADGEKLDPRPSRAFIGFCLTDYFEDETGKPMNGRGMMNGIMGGSTHSLGDPTGIVEIGPTPIARPEMWTVQKSNTVAHFLEVVHCLSMSKWVTTSTSVSYSLEGGVPGDVIDFKTPDVLVLNSVLVFLRQLISQGDKLFKLASDAYLCHVSDEHKKFWVTHERQRITDMLNAKDAELDGRSGDDLIKLMFYGFGLIHRDIKEAPNFQAMLAKHGREKVMLAFHELLQCLYARMHNVAHVFRQDFAAWVSSGQCVPPDRISISDLLGDIRPER